MSLTTRFLAPAAVLLAMLPIEARAQKLLYEFPHLLDGGFGLPDNPFTHAAFCMGILNPPLFEAGYVRGTSPDNNATNPFLGCATLPVGQVGYLDFDSSSPGFNDVVARLTDDVVDPEQGRVGLTTLNLNSSGDVVAIGGTSLEHETSELIGASVGFIRVVVFKNDPGNSGEWLRDSIWQVWSGTPLFSGGGQRTEVNDFLRYRNPLDATTVLAQGAASFALTVLYGASIDVNTFGALLNGQPLSGLTPIPGTSETVIVPVAQGRNVLILSASGTTSSGRVAADRDRLTIIVP